VSNVIEIVEPFAIQDVFCTGLVRVERLGPVRRLVFYSTTTGYAGGTERHVVSKLVMTAEVMQQIAVLLFADHPDKVLDEATAARAAAH